MGNSVKAEAFFDESSQMWTSSSFVPEQRVLCSGISLDDFTRKRRTVTQLTKKVKQRELQDECDVHQTRIKGLNKRKCNRDWRTRHGLHTSRVRRMVENRTSLDSTSPSTEESTLHGRIGLRTNRIITSTIPSNKSHSLEQTTGRPSLSGELGTRGFQKSFITRSITSV